MMDGREMNHDPIDAMVWDAQRIIEICRELEKDELNACGIMRCLGDIEQRTKTIKEKIQEVHI